MAWEVDWQALPAESDLPERTDTRLAPNARLVGYEPLPAQAVTGDVWSLRLAWREAKSFFAFGSMANNFVLFEWRQHGQRLAEQLDPLPWPIEAWGDAALLLSQHKVIVPPSLAAGRYELVVMLHNSSDPAGRPFSLGLVEVTAPAHQFDLPAQALPPAGAAQLAGAPDPELVTAASLAMAEGASPIEGIELAGYNFDLSAAESANPSLDLQLYWRTSIPLTTRYKVFAQLLDADQTLVAQSDNIPAAGQRPTTGWLPQEIITDAHTLSLPPGLPSGSYRLIAGLYNPLTGERLPVLNQPPGASADEIWVAEVTLP